MSKKNKAPESNQQTMELDPDDVTNPDEENEEEEDEKGTQPTVVHEVQREQLQDRVLHK